MPSSCLLHAWPSYATFPSGTLLSGGDVILYALALSTYGLTGHGFQGEEDKIGVGVLSARLRV